MTCTNLNIPKSCAKSPCGIGALYCKESCRDDAFSRFHSLECGKPTLNGIPDSSVRLAFRMYYTLSSGDVKRKHVGEKEEENEGMKISSLSSPTSSSNDRESISKLVDHIQELDKKVKERDLLLEHVMVGTLLHSISPTPTRFVKRLATLDDLRKYHDLVMELLSLVLKARCNSFSIKHHSESSSSSPSPSSTSNILPPASVGSGIYLSASLLNHSCNPNCLVFFSKNTIIIRSSRSIKVGEELCISYGPLSPRHLLGDRHMALLKRWHFKCSCKECNSGNPYRQDLSARLYHGWKCPECKGGSTLPFSESSFDPAMCTECYGGGELTAECEIEDRAAYYYDLVSRVMSRDGDATSSSSSSITFEDQVSTLEKCLHFRQQVLSSPNGKLGATHDLLGRLYASRGHFQLAASHVRKSLSSVIFSFGKWSIEASGEYAKLAGLLVQCEEFDEAKAVAKDGIECFKRVYGITGDYTTDNDEDVNEDIEELYQILEI